MKENEGGEGGSEGVARMLEPCLWTLVQEESLDTQTSAPGRRKGSLCHRPPQEPFTDMQIKLLPSRQVHEAQSAAFRLRSKGKTCSLKQKRVKNIRFRVG